MRIFHARIPGEAHNRTSAYRFIQDGDPALREAAISWFANHPGEVDSLVRAYGSMGVTQEEMGRITEAVCAMDERAIKPLVENAGRIDFMHTGRGENARRLLTEYAKASMGKHQLETLIEAVEGEGHIRVRNNALSCIIRACSDENQKLKPRDEYEKSRPAVASVGRRLVKNDDIDTALNGGRLLNVVGNSSVDLNHLRLLHTRFAIEVFQITGEEIILHGGFSTARVQASELGYQPGDVVHTFRGYEVKERTSTRKNRKHREGWREVNELIVDLRRRLH